MIMKRRIVAAIAAVVLAGVAAYAIFSYVQRADARAMAGQQTAEVLVTTKPVAKGSTADEMSESVELKLMPQMAIAPGAVSHLDQIRAGMITTAPLEVGEQVISTRFADPVTLTDANSAPVPKGLQEVSVQLDAQRALGGNIKPGDMVGVFLSIEVEMDGDKNGGDKKDSITHLTLHNVLVTKVQGGLAPMPEDGDSADQTAPMPEEQSLMVTLAVNAAQAEKIVFTGEYGHVWLSEQNADSDQSGTRILTEEGLYR